MWVKTSSCWLGLFLLLVFESKVSAYLSNI